MELPARIEQKIEYEPNSACWIWTGACTRDGYPEVMWQGGTRRAHRLIFEMLRSPIPPGLTLDHLCRVRCCVNPHHLEPTTIGVNGNRGFGQGALNGRKTHCPQGHPYDITYSGQRGCRRCMKESNRVAVVRYYYRHRAPRS